MDMYFRRHLEKALRSSISRNKVRLLFGARQTGKTELLKHLLPEHGSRFFNLQNASERRRFEADPGAFGRTIRALPKSVKYVVLDEIQKVPPLLDEIQSLHDESASRHQFYLTGSSARRLRTTSSNLLPGRAHLFHLFPVCGWEVEGSSASVVAAPKKSANSGTRLGPAPFPAKPLDRCLLLGNLPGIRSEAPATARATLEAYTELYLEEEVRREALVRDMGPFSEFLRIAASEAGQQINVANLSQQSGVPASTIKNYYQVLVDTFVGYWMHPYGRSYRRRVAKSPRFYFFDVGVRNVAAGVDLQQNLTNQLGGVLLEQYVGVELTARASYCGRNRKVSFWRTSSGIEVDFVWESPGEDIPMEVNWTSHPRPADARHLEKFLDEHAERANRGFVICRCPEPQQLTKRVRAIPWRDL